MEHLIIIKNKYVILKTYSIIFQNWKKDHFIFLKKYTVFLQKTKILYFFRIFFSENIHSENLKSPIVCRSDVWLWTWVQCGTLNSIFFDQRFKLDPWTWTWWSYWPVQQCVLNFGKWFHFPFQKVNMLGPQRAYRPEFPRQGYWK